MYKKIVFLFTLLHITVIYCYSEMELVKNSTLSEINNILPYESDLCTSKTTCPIKKSRKKRFIYFPNGSNFVATLSTVKTILVTIPNGWNLVLEFDVIYHLPTEKDFFRKIKHSTLKRRQRRQLWSEIEKSLEYQNLDGEACVYKAICEAEKALLPEGQSMVHDIIRVLFRVTDEEESAYEPSETFHPKNNSDNYRKIFKEDRCKEYTSEDKCPISLIDILMSFTQNVNDFSTL